MVGESSTARLISGTRERFQVMPCASMYDLLYQYTMITYTILSDRGLQLMKVDNRKGYMLLSRQP